MSIHLAIAEDNPFALKSVINKLSIYPDILIKTIAQNGEELLEKIKDQVIHVVLMDIEMPVMDGISATRFLKERNAQIKVIALTTFDDDDKILEMVKSGAAGYLLKEEGREVIERAIRDALSGGASMSPSIALKVMNLLRYPLTENTPAPKIILTKREIEVVEQLKNGCSYQDIADNLFISYGTVRKHIENIYKKLNVDNKVAAVNLVNSHRLV